MNILRYLHSSRKPNKFCIPETLDLDCCRAVLHGMQRDHRRRLFSAASIALSLLSAGGEEQAYA
jgi:hypothetical protein